MEQPRRMHKKKTNRVDAMATRQSSSFGLFALPLLVMGVLHVVVTPLGNILALSWVYATVWYGLGVLVGYILMRRTRVTRITKFSSFGNNEENETCLRC